jgi:hypothetical protein
VFASPACLLSPQSRPGVGIRRHASAHCCENLSLMHGLRSR